MSQPCEGMQSVIPSEKPDRQGDGLNRDINGSEDRNFLTAGKDRQSFEKERVMKPIEISDDLFCGRIDFCDAAVSNGCEELSCGEYHRKWPTPEQYLEEYGKEYPDDWAVYFTKAGQWFEYQIDNYATAKNWQKEFPDDIWIIICACTIFGKPDDYWRPL